MQKFIAQLYLKNCSTEYLQEMLSMRTIRLISQNSFHVSKKTHHRLKRCISSSKSDAANESNINKVQYALASILCLVVFASKIAVAAAFGFFHSCSLKLGYKVIQAIAAVPLDMESIP